MGNGCEIMVVDGFVGGFCWLIGCVLILLPDYFQFY
jgi:hypothetical protein